jgi:uncharacterized RDD family membrane protein YckC
MAYCAYCGAEISDQAVACMRCGHPNEALRAAEPPAGAVVAGLIPAGFWLRFLAVLLDGLIVGIPAFLIFGERVYVQTQYGPIASWHVDFLPWATMWFLYTWLLTGLNHGQTVGKMALGIRVLTADGHEVDIGRAAGRQGMSVVSFIPLGLGYLWAAWDPQKRTWHDMVVNTRSFRRA